MDEKPTQATIPQIKPDVTHIEEPNTDTGSILIPKLDKLNSAPVAPTPKKFPARLLSRFSGKKIGVGLTVVLLIFLVMVIVPSVLVGLSAKRFYGSAQVLANVAKEQDIEKIRKELKNTESSLSALKSSYRLASWMKFIPFLGGYIADAGHAIYAADYGLEAGDSVLDAVEPYGDIVGLKNGKGQSTSGEETTRDRVDFIVKSLPDLTPKIDEIAAKMTLVQKEIDQIDPNRYPEKFRGKPVRSKIVQGIDLVNQATGLVTYGKPLLQQAPYLLGIDSPRTYLVLFQNDKELRPTGGFLTAYSIMKVDKAKFDPVISSDIYNLDAKYKPSTPAPEPIVKYIKGPYILSTNLRLRDMNWSPDFRESIELFIDEADKIGLEEVDGVIAVDTHLLVSLLDVIGPIGVPGFGNFSTKITPECNCPQVIYELESFADVEGPIVWDPISGKIIYRPPNSDNRKKIIGPLMNSILANTLGQPKEKLPDLFEAGFKSLEEKHVLFYMFDKEAQAAVESFNIAGRIKQYDGDFLHINDANLGGRKSNLYVTQEVNQEIKVAKDGSVEKTVTITYKNPEKHDGWLNSVLPNWVRVYVPKGSQLIDVEGLESQAKPYEEFNKTVFAGFFQLRPQGVSKVTLKYKLPNKFKKDYKLLIQKQPGTGGPLYTVRIGRQEQEFFLLKDTELKIGI